MCICEEIGSQKYSVTQPLSYHVYLWSNGQPRIDQIHFYTHGLDIQSFMYPGFYSTIMKVSRILIHTNTEHMFGLPTTVITCVLYLWRNGQSKIAQIVCYTQHLDISLVLWSQLVPKSFNDGVMSDSTPHRHPTHIKSPNYCHRMCICEGIDTEKSLNLSFIHPTSTFHFVYVLNFRQSPSMMEVSQILLLTGRSSSSWYRLKTSSVSHPLTREWERVRETESQRERLKTRAKSPRERERDDFITAE